MEELKLPVIVDFASGKDSHSFFTYSFLTCNVVSQGPRGIKPWVNEDKS